MLSRLACLSLLMIAAPASAATTIFKGTLTNTNPPAAPGGRCGATLTVNIGPGFGVAKGTSIFGNFVPTNSHCITPPLPTNYSNGLFSLDFSSGNILTGTYSGTLSTTAQPGVFANLQQFTVTGGSGRFGNTTGSFTGIGTVTFAAGMPPASFETLSGSLNVGAVPEPASWALMLGGFGMLGGALRRQKWQRLAVASGA